MVPAVVPLTMLGMTGASLLAKAIGNQWKKDDEARLSSQSPPPAPTPTPATTSTATPTKVNPLIQAIGNVGGQIFRGGEKLLTGKTALADAVENKTPLISPLGQWPTTTLQQSPLKNSVLGIQSTTPAKIVNPTASPEVTPTLAQLLAGRTAKFESAKKANEEGYKNLLSTLDNLGATPLEKQIALDVAAQESMLGQIDKNYDWPNSTSRGTFMFNNGTWSDYLKANPDAAKRNADQSNMKDATEAFLFAIRNGITGQGLSRWNASRDVWGQGYTPEELSTFVQ